ncbi:hypothetical protein PRZ48_007429 [Zasmidium cellare]|uniref:FAD-binding domain-containing protein n=1 Tax=Zasmidium cellare TaxID=395010 RepID=A0ABR0EJE6_ZASCE|nr:hypothetical protein PRZ48_007429 [Zasmidium cellare]
MILIIGAGLAGLSLARTLRKSGIPYRIFDQAASDRYQGYGLSLHAETMPNLLEMLELDEKTLRDQISVNKETPFLPQSLCDAVTGEAYGSTAAAFHAAEHRSFRTNRERLWKTIRGDVVVEYGCKLVKIEHHEHKVVAKFANGKKVEGSLLVAADGVHSSIRGILLPEIVLKDWNGVMFNGVRKLSKDDFDKNWAPYMDGLCTKIGFYDNCLLAVTLYDQDPVDGAISISWAWSQRKRGENDHLFVPYSAGKDKWRAAPLPWDDLEQLPPLALPWENVYHDSQLRQDFLIRQQLLNHLIPRERLEAVLHDRRVVFIGDAARSWSNHAGTAGNEALLDGIALGKVLVNDQGVEDLYEQRFHMWEKAIAYNTKMSESMHRPREEWLRNRPATNGAT